MRVVAGNEPVKDKKLIVLDEPVERTKEDDEVDGVELVSVTGFEEPLVDSERELVNVAVDDDEVSVEVKVGEEEEEEELTLLAEDVIVEAEVEPVPRSVLEDDALEK